MNEMPPAAAFLVGDWRSVLCSDANQTGFFRVSHDQKFFSAVDIKESFSKGPRYGHLRLLMEDFSDTAFKLRFAGKPGGADYCYSFDGSVLVLRTGGVDKEFQWDCYRIGAEDLPEYFEEEFRKAMELPWN